MVSILAFNNSGRDSAEPDDDSVDDAEMELAAPTEEEKRDLGVHNIREWLRFRLVFKRQRRADKKLSRIEARLQGIANRQNIQLALIVLLIAVSAMSSPPAMVFWKAIGVIP